MTSFPQINKMNVLGACLVAAAGGLVFNTFPQVLTLIAMRFDMGETEIGTLISAFMGAFALSALFAPYWMPRYSWKIASVVGYVLVVVGVVMLGQVTKGQVIFAMSLTGLGSGVLLTVAVGILAAAKDPDSAYGYMLSVQMIVGAVLIYAVANLIVSQFGYSGFVFGLVGVFMLTSIGIFWLPANFLGQAKNELSSIKRVTGKNMSALMAMAAMFLYFGAYTGVWSFVANVGIEHGFHEDTINVVLTFALLSGIVGALLCAWMGQRFGHGLPLAGGMLATIISVVLLAHSSSIAGYAIAVCSINALLQYVVAYQMGLITEVDNDGRFTVLIAFVLAISAAICGDLMGRIIETYGLDIALYGSIGAIAAAMVLSCVILYKGQAQTYECLAEVE